MGEERREGRRKERLQFTLLKIHLGAAGWLSLLEHSALDNRFAGSIPV